MKTYVLTSLLLLSTFTTAIAQNCDCTIFPFEPDSCFEICVAEIFNEASLEEFTLILGIDRKLSQKLVLVREKIEFESLHDLENDFSEEEIETLIESAHSINQTQNEYFNKPKHQRMKLNQEIKNLNLENMPR